MTSAVSNPHDVSTGILQCWDDEIALARCYQLANQQYVEAGGTAQVWNQAVWIARVDRARADPGYPPDLIDLDDGRSSSGNPNPPVVANPATATATITTGHGRARSWRPSIGSRNCGRSIKPNSTVYGRSTSTRPRTTISDDQDRRPP